PTPSRTRPIAIRPRRSPPTPYTACRRSAGRGLQARKGRRRASRSGGLLPAGLLSLVLVVVFAVFAFGRDIVGREGHQIGNDVVNLVIGLEAGKGHLGAFDVGIRLVQVFEQRFLGPYQ